MIVNKGVRQDMLENSLWDKIDDSFVGGKGKVEFFDNSGNDLCELEFDDMAIVSTGTDNAIMRLKSIDGSFTLKGTAHDPGTVSTFKILGTDPQIGPDEYILTGSIGTLTSSAELRFNIVNWVDGTYVTIGNFDIIIPNGS